MRETLKSTANVIECSPTMLEHYRQFSQFTDPGAYTQRVVDELPDDVREMGVLIRRQIVHRMTLSQGNTGSNEDLRYGDMTKIPWWRQPEDDYFPTAVSILAELYRRDKRGFVQDRAEVDKMILTCRFVALLVASVLKAKGYPARVRSGFDPYTTPRPGISCDHWITQYWRETEKRWCTIDVDCCIEDLEFDPFDMPVAVFDWSADVWLDVRAGKVNGEYFGNACGIQGLMPIAWELFYDFHCLMNNEIIYLHSPMLVKTNDFENMPRASIEKIDALAILMQRPDENFEKLKDIYTNNQEFRLLGGALL